MKFNWLVRSGHRHLCVASVVNDASWTALDENSVLSFQIVTPDAFKIPEIISSMIAYREDANKYFQEHDWCIDKVRFHKFAGDACSIITNNTTVAYKGSIDRLIGLPEAINDSYLLNRCPVCGQNSDNGTDRETPPNTYLCSKCMIIQEAEIMTTEHPSKDARFFAGSVLDYFQNNVDITSHLCIMEDIDNKRGE